MVYVMNIEPKPTPRPRVKTVEKFGKRINMTYYPAEYQKYKDNLCLYMKSLNAKPDNYGKLKVIFGIPYPKVVKGGKKMKIEGKPHQQKPDFDNFLKGVKDGLTQSGILSVDDSSIYYVEGSKLWTNTNGYIKFFLQI